MKTTALILLSAASLVTTTARAQFVNDGATNVLSNVTNNSANITVGTNGPFTLLVLSNNTLLNNTVNAVIGRNASAQSNEVRIIGDTARWAIGSFGTFVLGSNGAASRLTISEGGKLQNFFFGYLGQNSSSSNNAVFVTDPGSQFSGAILFLGGGGGNQLTVSNGATAWNGGTTVGLGSSSNNLVTVTGAGSIWTNDTGMSFGSSGNRMIVSAGGRLANVNSTVGLDSSANHNTVLLTDSGSGWTNSSSIRVGDGGIGNQVIVSNGAVIYVGDNAFIGLGNTGSSNSLVLTDPGTRFLRGLNTDITIGSNSPFNRLVISNGAVADCRIGELGFSLNGDANEALVTGPGSAWRTTLGTIVGRNGAGNRLTISDGAFVSSLSGMLGLNSGGSNNIAMVTGLGSIWTNELDCYVGNLAPGNRLVLSNGAAVYTGNNSVIGIESGARLNSVIVTDVDTRWMIASNLYVGSNGPFNRLTIANGARVENGLGVIGARIACNSNEVVVTGAGSIWTNSDWLYVGRNGAFNRLVVTNGGQVRSFGGWIGEYINFFGTTNADNNEAIVTGTGSLWQLGFGSLFVGDWRNTGNRLVVSDGASVINSICYIGAQSTNNLVLVTGPGSTWSNRNFVALGQGGAGNRLLVTNAASVFANSFECGIGGTDGNNLVRVDDGTLRTAPHPATGKFDVQVATTALNSGLMDIGLLLLTNTQGRFEFNGGTLITRGASINNGMPFTVGRSGTTPAIWDVRSNALNHALAGRLIVGSNASFNQIFITNGATLTGGEYTFLAFTSGSNNAVTVSGPGSTLNSPSGFFIGADGNANRMLISNGGKAIASLGNSGTFIGRSIGTRSNLVVVADPDSQWSIRDIFYVGAGGNANQLVVSNGAKVDSLIGYVGSGTFASNNLATVTGNNSSWSNRSELYIGSSGSGNRLVVSDGAMVINSNANLAMDLSSRSNTVLVSGVEARWNCRADLIVGYDGTDNLVTVSNGGLISVLGTLLVSRNVTTSSGNRLVVDGGTVVVTNGGATGLLEIRRGTNVLNAGLIETDILRMTNAQSKMEFKGGTLSMKGSRVSIGNPLIVGDGSSPATLSLAGNGTHDFSGTLGLILTNNATLTGKGTVLAQLQVRSGARLAPGASVGKISFNAAPSLAGSLEMEISKNGTTLTNDQIQLNNNGTLTYGGSLIVTNLGPTALLPGDRFQLFIAGGYAGSFSAITLPPLPAPLSWTNKLLVDGSIEVIAPPAIPMSGGTYAQSFDSLSASGGANLWRDNSTLLGWYAAKSVAPNPVTNYIASDGSGNAGALYSFGSTGSPERALGSIGSGTPGNISYGLAFANDTGASVSNFFITYTGEQWRNGGGVANTLAFWYRVSPAIITSSELAALTNWTAVTNLDFAAPSAVTPTGFALDGNLATNRQIFSSVPIPGLTVPPGQNVFFRWHDADSAGTDQGMAVDDLLVTFEQILPQITAVGVTTNGFIQLVGVAESNRPFGIETTTNLAAPIVWQLIFTNTADTSGVFQFTDTNPPALPMRFYRASFQ